MSTIRHTIRIKIKAALGCVLGLFPPGITEQLFLLVGSLSGIPSCLPGSGPVSIKGDIRNENRWWGYYLGKTDDR